ncbi:hypothetical protein [Archaeoglobus veneficus]|uniref:Uncharacterized protein n=1 Tax=Archaeoglobus veneficus (strain DSM 11195 / SNP6) TaxID=693661 RepID=F2KSF7_ARCVS|nr:hypothetical protein [Archaeoglobus veneficus]AEA46926.1 hypothetical protein Arcve_0915 [Archaeoglobus veneficus SNP6]
MYRVLFIAHASMFASLWIVGEISKRAVSRLYFGVPAVLFLTAGILTLHGYYCGYLEFVAALIAMLSARKILEMGIFASPEFRPPLVEKYTVAAWIAGFAAALHGCIDVEKVFGYTAHLFIAQLFAYFALASRHSGLKRGDFEAFTVAAAMALVGGMSHLSVCVLSPVEAVGAYSMYSACLIFLLSTVRSYWRCTVWPE